MIIQQGTQTGRKQTKAYNNQPCDRNVHLPKNDDRSRNGHRTSTDRTYGGWTGRGELQAECIDSWDGQGDDGAETDATTKRCCQGEGWTRHRNIQGSQQLANIPGQTLLGPPETWSGAGGASSLFSYVVLFLDTTFDKRVKRPRKGRRGRNLFVDVTGVQVVHSRWKLHSNNGRQHRARGALCDDGNVTIYCFPLYAAVKSMMGHGVPLLKPVRTHDMSLLLSRKLGTKTTCFSTYCNTTTVVDDGDTHYGNRGRWIYPCQGHIHADTCIDMYIHVFMTEPLRSDAEHLWQQFQGTPHIPGTKEIRRTPDPN